MEFLGSEFFSSLREDAWVLDKTFVDLSLCFFFFLSFFFVDEERVYDFSLFLPQPSFFFSFRIPTFSPKSIMRGWKI